MSTKKNDRLTKEISWHIFFCTDSEFLKVSINLLISFKKSAGSFFDEHRIKIVMLGSWEILALCLYNAY